MGLKIADLLKFRSEVTLTHPETGEPILNPDNKKPVVVYLRLIGDDDVEATHKASRLASATYRRQL